MKNVSIIFFVCYFFSILSCKKSSDTISILQQTELSSKPARALCPNTFVCTINKAAMVQLDSSIAGGQLYANTNYNNYPVFKTESWIGPIHTFESRSLLQFNLPPNFFSGFSFCQADLVLQEYPDINSNTYFGVANPYFVTQTPNAAQIVRIRSNWQQNSVTWNTQPTVAAASAATIPGITTSPSYTAGSDNPTITITGIMQDVQNRGVDRGIEIRMPVNGIPSTAARQFGAKATTPLSFRAKLIFYY